MTIIAATFKSQEDAEEALYALEDISITPDQVSFVATEESRQNFSFREGDNSDDAASAGANVGGIGGAIFGALAVTGAVLIPGLNVFVAGPLVGALAGLAVGAGTGGLLGALIGAGLSEDDAEIYETEVRQGGIILTVNAVSDDQAKQIRKIFRKSDARDIAA